MDSVIYGHAVCANCRKGLHLLNKPVWLHAKQEGCNSPELKYWNNDWKDGSEMRIIGICGFAQSGKDTLAKELVERDGFERRSFADPMRNILYAINPTIERDSSGLARTVRLQQIVNTMGWDRAKVEYPEIRRLLQMLGTEGGRKHISEDVWVRACLDNAKTDKIAITDVRFPNEAKAIHERGGIVVRIIRFGVAPTNDHESETAYTDQDIILENNGTPQELYEKYVQAIEKWRGNN